MRGPRCTYTPSREELRQACEEIQRGWTPTERLKRLVTRLPGWFPPTIHVAELAVRARAVSDN